MVQQHMTSPNSWSEAPFHTMLQIEVFDALQFHNESTLNIYIYIYISTCIYIYLFVYIYIYPFDIFRNIKQY